MLGRNPSLCVFVFLLYSFLVAANDFAGANSFFLYALSQVDRIAVLDAMKNADMKLLRIFITRVGAGSKGSSATAVNDLETAAGMTPGLSIFSMHSCYCFSVGSYDDAILGQIDTLAAEAHARGKCYIKLIIAMHDRYAWGCWDTDAYVAKYNLPVTNCVNGVPDSSIFYTNANAIADFDNRLRHILNFRSSNFGVPWHELSDAIFAFEIQNEAMGHMNQVAPNWWCDRASIIRSVLGNTGILISTGGGTDLPTSTQSQFFSCANLQVIALHDYNLDPSYVASHVDAVKPLALSSGKRMIYEEFGATGSSKQSQIQAVTDTLIATGVPWMYWGVVKPGKASSDYEVWTDEPTWSTLLTQSQATRRHVGEFGWPEIDAGI